VGSENKPKVLPKTKRAPRIVLEEPACSISYVFDLTRRELRAPPGENDLLPFLGR
jgi:hypothetical protein